MINQFDIIRFPVITEKSTLAQEAGKFTFQVDVAATKDQVKQAVEKIFQVKVKKVNILNRQGKVTRFKGIQGKQVRSKKAIVTLESGQTIDVTAEV